ncbi:MAG: hypothetical protein N7Q72_01625, partial [Spiroplasma sp. Tabriz.8]|nr:hypothetical protein [Spiroplasma sp. Tabriz.8]
MNKYIKYIINIKKIYYTFNSNWKNIKIYIYIYIYISIIFYLWKYKFKYKGWYFCYYKFWMVLFFLFSHFYFVES